MYLSQVDKMRMVFDHSAKKPFCIVTKHDGTIIKHAIDLAVDKGQSVTTALVNTSSIRENRTKAYHYISADSTDLHTYGAIWTLLNSPLVESHSATHKETGDFPGMALCVRLRGLEPTIDLSYETNEVGEPFYKAEGLVPLNLLKWWNHMYHYMGIEVTKQLKPDDFANTTPWGSVLGSSEAEGMAQRIMLCLTVTNENEWKQLTWTDYCNWQKDFNNNNLKDDLNIKVLFDEVVDYCTSPATAFLFSKDWKALKTTT